MNLDFGNEYDKFRAEVTDFCSKHKGVQLTGNLFFRYETIKRSRSSNSDGETMPLAEWQKLLIENGYFARNIPKQYGGYGGDLDIVKNVIINTEFSKAGIPSGTGGQGIDFLVPTLLEMGTEEQRQQYIKPALHLETIWCQGYSEPNAGSDLASLQTKGVLDGDEWVINGQKIWTSTAKYSQMMFCLVRTEPDEPKHKGISYLLIPMDAPGIEIRPLVDMTLDAGFNEVFFTDVRIPATNIVGKRG
ncbi:MAG: acyl-CoA dehydrogenase family protein, partial [Gammaproteobacteria bacterium]|nr:acyl-CoA dehydrogenase family protein [Gammaproteobacteria bacterium]